MKITVQELNGEKRECSLQSIFSQHSYRNASNEGEMESIRSEIETIQKFNSDLLKTLFRKDILTTRDIKELLTPYLKYNEEIIKIIYN